MHGRQLISSGSPWELVVGYSRAVRVGPRAALLNEAWKVEIEVEAICDHDQARQ